MFDYNSSEEFRRHKADVFAIENAKSQNDRDPEIERLRKLLESHIVRHKDVTRVRAEATRKGRENGYQLDLSADIVEILEKIKSELR